MLKVESINSYYGHVHALTDVSFELHGNEIVSIIGANGAGKSTLMKSIMGVVRPRSGDILYKGESIIKHKTSDIVKNGIVYVPEGREIFPDISVQDNLQMGAFSKKFSAKEMKDHLEQAYDLFPRLKERRRQMGGSLSGGEQQMLAIARGMMSDPELIMFDEPSLGLAPIIVDAMFNAIVKINKEKNIPIVLVEQNAFMALSISERCYILENGVVTKQGDSQTILNDDAVRKAYLGG